jgi:hypothetical protein
MKWIPWSVDDITNHHFPPCWQSSTTLIVYILVARSLADGNMQTLSLHPSLQTQHSHTLLSSFLPQPSSYLQPSPPGPLQADTLAAVVPVNPVIDLSLSGPTAGIGFQQYQLFYPHQAHPHLANPLQEHWSAMQIELAKLTAEQDTLQYVVIGMISLSLFFDWVV